MTATWTGYPVEHAVVDCSVPTCREAATGEYVEQVAGTDVDGVTRVVETQLCGGHGLAFELVREGFR